MTIRSLLIFGVLSAGQIMTVAQKENVIVPSTLNLQQAVELALEHNHDVRISSLKVEEDEHAREVARSAYLPVLRNDTTFFHVTDTQFIEIPAGSFGSVGSNPIPPRDHVLNQGGRDIFTSGTGLTQPLTELFKIRAANDAARAEVKASRGKAQNVKNQVELNVRRLYYKILIVGAQRQAIEAKIRALEDLHSERVQQVKYGSTLEADLIESRAQSLEAKQELLTSDLQLSDLRMQFNDILGLPVKSEVALDPAVPVSAVSCTREECVKVAFDSNPEIAEAKAEIEKASAGVRAAKREYIPDVEAIARYSHQNSSVPFLAPDFGTFGVHAGYDIFDGGKKRAMLRESDVQLAKSKENLARISDEVEVKVLAAYNKIERTEQMVAVSRELLAARKEARRVSAQGLDRGTHLPSQADAAIAQESEAQTQFLQSQLEYAQAQDELNEAIGRSADQ
jgi:outer membrane protein TolC